MLDIGLFLCWGTSCSGAQGRLEPLWFYTDGEICRCLSMGRTAISCSCKWGWLTGYVLAPRTQACCLVGQLVQPIGGSQH